ncbi:DUF3572 domain-containing protein [Thalassovita mediterranea]|jgi:hypothetical protein|uniref:DUF3572 domain-containing protein n=1 Tax=Thalassovita mediterranea TaxID=340021 RepID=A0A0P1H1R3_9RHOB|nr:DUF3572 domain-containing protein [Thalassovita mediterranea]CUH83936.1 hypothetical protein TM5383_01140 [Thalassovita mediterranea]SIS28078.1 Protein of unknown function [Thalassovita mediterranea]
MSNLSPDAAETLALQVLGWLAGNDELLPVFMGASGVSQDDLRVNAGSPEFLASVLDFLLMDDAWVISCCDALNRPYDSLIHARAALPGGAQINWT